MPLSAGFDVGIGGGLRRRGACGAGRVGFDLHLALVALVGANGIELNAKISILELIDQCHQIDLWGVLRRRETLEGAVHRAEADQKSVGQRVVSGRDAALKWEKQVHRF